ncbi:MAG TPA: hypothetical protein VI854_00750 [Acidimicrobiia bacterium]|nr:hypothetical protein [Acidimicrobiia bacterium]
MGAQRSTFGKLERDRAKKAKAAAKRERRLERKAEAAEGAPAPEIEESEGTLSAAELLAQIEITHQRFEAGEMSHEEFEEKKAELFSRLPID